MESTLQEVVKYCSKQLDAYQKCVESNSQDWDTKCAPQKAELTKCSEENVSVLRNIKKECGGIISKYDQCLSKNTSQPEKCIEALQDLYHCSARVAKQEGIQI